jgi:hypothetical protein
MILPVPNPDTIQFHNLSNYTELFNDCNNCFIKKKNKLITKSFDSSSTFLPVFNIGSYQVSIAMSLTDIKHIDSSIFTLSNGCDELLSKEYNNPIFGFIICKLENSEKEYHPFGYSHNIYNNMLFIPTKHYHTHNTIPFYTPYSDNYYTSSFSNICDNLFGNERSNHNISDDWSHDWSHEIYLYNATLQQNVNFVTKNSFKWNNNNNIKQNKINFNFNKLNHFEKHTINGEHKNIDLYADLIQSY